MPLRFLLILILTSLTVCNAARALAQDLGSASDSLFADLGLPEIILTATDYDLTLSQTQVPSGRYLITLRNEGWDPELQVSVVKLGVEDLRADTSCVNGLPPECFDWYYRTLIPGGVSGLSPHTILDLSPGTYGLWGPGELSILPAAILEVTGRSDVSTIDPKPDSASIVVAESSDGTGTALQIQGEFSSGRQIVQIINSVEWPVMIVANQEPWRSNGDHSGSEAVPVLETIDAEEMTRVLASIPQSSGTTQWLSMDLAPGPIYLACYVLDPIVMAYASHWDPSATAIAYVSVAEVS